jgi:LCP family protein required for cell wall assembly
MRTTLKRGVSRASAASGNGDGNGAAQVSGAPPRIITPMTRYAPPRRSPLRLVGRVFAWLLVTLLVTVVGLAGGLWLWGEHTVAETRPQTAAEKEAQEILDQVPPADQPAVALVVGYDFREGESARDESRSDTLMLLRADPSQKTISMLSFPRDLLVELPGCDTAPPRLAKINEAYTDCGIKGTIETVRQLTGVPINYYITVDFRGFIDIVNKLGGVYMDVDRRYFNDNSQGGPSYSAIDLQPGYQRLDGRRALAFVRYRHTDNDFYRNARQQEFVKAVKHQVSGLGAAWKLRGIVQTITDTVTIGSGGGKELQLDTLLSYALLAYELPSGNLFQPRLENLTDNEFFQLLAPEGEIERAVDEFMNPDPDAAAKATSVAIGGKAPASKRTGPPASQVSITVLNGNGVAGAADDAAYILSQRGYPALNGGNADRLDYFETQIEYDPAVAGAEGAANTMAKLFGDAELVEATAGAPLDTMLRVIVGTTFHGTLAPAPRDTTPEAAPPVVVTDPASAEPHVREAQRKADFPVLVPTVRESASHLSTVDAMRVYKLQGHGAVRFVYSGPTELDYWGIQQTSFTEAPALEGATLTRKVGGREYRLYFNGPKLHMVAFEENGAAYWVVNTLLDKLSNETMLAIAKGLKPLGNR